LRRSRIALEPDVVVTLLETRLNNQANPTPRFVHRSSHSSPLGLVLASLAPFS
jgi:hypothetical protein